LDDGRFLVNNGLGGKNKMEKDHLRIKKLVWHDIKTVEAAKIARVPALVFSIFGTFLWAVITLATVSGHKSTYGNLGFVYLAFFAAISFGLFKMRREASIGYFVVSVVAVIFAWGHTARLLSAVAGVFVALLAIRGTFSYARFCGNHEQMPTSNQRSDRDRA